MKVLFVLGMNRGKRVEAAQRRTGQHSKASNRCLFRHRWTALLEASLSTAAADKAAASAVACS